MSPHRAWELIGGRSSRLAVSAPTADKDVRPPENSQAHCGRFSMPDERRSAMRTHESRRLSRITIQEDMFTQSRQ